jgi:cation diffusion facilitator CzcD-associated flavoprotein CzcO
MIFAGAGHCGLNTAARLAALGINSLIVDRLPRVGDCWRVRYEAMTIHDPVYSNHMAYLPFPPTYPVSSLVSR